MGHWSKLERCCCCISLEVGTRIIGAVFLLISLGEMFTVLQLNDELLANIKCPPLPSYNLRVSIFIFFLPKGKYRSPKYTEQSTTQTNLWRILFFISALFGGYLVKLEDIRLFVLDGLFDIPSCTIPPIDTLTDTVFEYSILANLLLVSTLPKISVIASLNCLPLRHCLPVGL